MYKQSRCFLFLRCWRKLRYICNHQRRTSQWRGERRVRPTTFPIQTFKGGETRIRMQGCLNLEVQGRLNLEVAMLSSVSTDLQRELFPGDPRSCFPGTESFSWRSFSWKSFSWKSFSGNRWNRVPGTGESFPGSFLAFIGQFITFSQNVNTTPSSLAIVAEWAMDQW